MELLETLKYHFGYDSFRPMQEEIILHTINGGDSLVLMPTGGGKSLCFQMAALMMTGVTVVVSPLISLMKDQVDNARANGIAAEALNSAGDAAANREVMQRCAEGRVKLLYMSPERLVSDINSFLRYIPISLFAIDEAHCISAWGHDFRPEYTQLGLLKETFPQVPIMALTATADKLTRQDILQQLNLPSAQLFIGSFDRPNLSLSVRRGLPEKERIRALVNLIEHHPGESGIIYCLSRKTSEKVAEKLREAGITAGVYHAGMPTAERTKVQDDFVADRIQVVCATIAFGMGIDKSNIRFIVHFNMPKSIENYYQEIGRGGRDGLPCETVLFYNLNDIFTLRKFAEESGQREINIDKLQRMQEYAEAQVCRRRILLNYFGEPNASDCHNCDVCLNPPQTFDGTVAVQKALSAIVRTGQKVGFTLLTDILRGTMSAEVVANNYQTIKTFGAGAEVPPRIWHDILLQMLQLGYVEVAYDEDHHLRITPLGNDVLYGRSSVRLSIVEHEAPKPRGRKRRVEQTADEISPVVDTSLAGQLRTLRRQLADESQVAPYIVMSDRSLNEIADAMPTTTRTLLAIGGMGRRRVDTYGEQIIATVRKYMEDNGIPIPVEIKEEIVTNEELTADADLTPHPPSPKPPKVRNHITIGGIRFDIDLDIWESVPWRDIIKDITNRAYWNYVAEQTVSLSEYLPTDIENRNRIVETLCRILSEGRQLPVDPRSETVTLPVKIDLDCNGNPVSLPLGTFEETLMRFRQFIEQNGRYPMIDGEAEEASLRKWFRHVGHGLLPVSDEQRAAFVKIGEDYPDVPKTRSAAAKE